MVIAVIVVTILVSCFYSFPYADDYFGAKNLKNAQEDSGDGGHSLIEASMVLTRSIYMSAQGVFFGSFVYYFFSTLLINLGLTGVRFFLFFSDIFFFLALFFVVKVLILSVFPEDRILAIPIYTVILFLIVSINVLSESLFWYCTNATYVVPLTIGLTGVGLTLSCINHNKNKAQNYLMGLACLCCFLASGGTLQIAAFTCFTELLILLVLFLSTGKIPKKVLIIFLAALTGVLINVAAPGNYSRRGNISAEWDLIGVMVDSLRWELVFIKDSLLTSIFPFILVIPFFLGLAFSKTTIIKPVNPILLLIALPIGLFLLIFPVVLGYSNANYMPGRVTFIIRVYLYLTMTLLAFYLGCLIKSKYTIRMTMEHKTIFAISVFLVVTFPNIQQFSSSLLIRQYIKGIVYGDFAAVSEQWEGIIHTLATTDETAVVFEMEKPSTPLLTNPGFGTDKNHWINRGIAMYYDKEYVYFE